MNETINCVTNSPRLDNKDSVMKTAPCVNSVADNAENEARQFLRSAGVFFYDDPSELDEDDNPKLLQTINFNDTWAWACAGGEYVPDAELQEVSRLFYCYGYCGILYWASELRDQLTSEFHDINRFIEFVRKEESIRKAEPDEVKRAYARHAYEIGAHIAPDWATGR